MITQHHISVADLDHPTTPHGTVTQGGVAWHAVVVCSVGPPVGSTPHHLGSTNPLAQFLTLAWLAGKPRVRVPVGVSVTVLVAVPLRVGVGVALRVGVGVPVGVVVGLEVRVGVAVAVVVRVAVRVLDSPRSRNRKPL